MYCRVQYIKRCSYLPTCLFLHSSQSRPEYLTTSRLCVVPRPKRNTLETLV